MQIANQYLEGFEPYQKYVADVRKYHEDLKKEMPFYTEEFSFMSLMSNRGGINYNSDLNWLEYYVEYEKINVMLTDMQNSNPFNMTFASPFDFTTPANYYIEEKIPNMILVKAGNFEMGGTSLPAEKPIHEVAIDFYIGKYEVMFAEYDLFCEDTKRVKSSDQGWTRYQRPVINVSWWDAIAYCNWLSDKANIPRAYDGSGNLLDFEGKKISDLRRVKGYRLPTEAEWEYGARGGHKKTGEFAYAGSNDLNEVGFYTDNSALNGFRGTQEVGKKQANDLGLYDMSGNAWEWCYDWWGDYVGQFQENSVGPARSSGRICRGGSWSYDASSCRVAERHRYSPTNSNDYLGFRFVRTK
jgi:formylglycine-generating enzyme required for sulfatase activity